MRTGVITRKLGMSSLFNNDGARFPVTLLKVEDCQVVDVKTVDKNGYSAILVGATNCKPSKVSKSIGPLFVKAKAQPKRYLKEFHVSQENILPLGGSIFASHFKVGQFVDATGVTIGKGFAGGMKRHNFRGLEASHGVSVSHRSHGSTGGRQDPGKVFKNKKMAGHLGSVTRTVRNLTVVGIDEVNNIVIIKGCVPSKNGIVYLRDAMKKR